MHSTNDHSTLKWIRGELDFALSVARRSLEEYSEDEDQALIDDCTHHLHQVHGTLQMMQIYGAAMLAEEMELVSIALQEEQVKRKEEAAEALMLAIIQLSEYLEKLEGGARDLPVLLLPLLNELRATREAQLLSELAFYSPELDRQLEQAEQAGDSNPDLPKFLKKNRHRYHKGLIEWYRDTDAKAGLQAIAKLFRQIESKSGTAAVSRLFQSGQALVEGLLEGSVESGFATKQLVGRIDRYYRSIMKGDETSLDADSANTCLKNLLFYVAGANSDNPVIQEVQERFQLADVILDEEALSKERDALHAPGRELFDSLSTAIGEDLTEIKDGLDLYIRANSDDLNQLAELEQPMRKLADTLGMVGQGGLRNRLKRQAEAIAESMEQGEALNDQDLMSMASDILYIETSLNNLSESRHSYNFGGSDAEQDSVLPEGEFESLVDSVMHEAALDMTRSKDAVISYIEAPEAENNLPQVAAKFRSIAGAFNILKLSEPAELLEQLARYVEDRLIAGEDVPPVTELNSFADAVTSIEYFMETIAEGRGVQSDILKVTKEAISDLGMEPEQGVAEVVDLVAPEEGDRPTEGGPEIDQPVEQESEVEHVASADKPPLEDIDPEILDIFIEEAREEMGVIGEYLPRWLSDHDDNDALITFRRSFHTLKGSGRLVGASTIGELAWSIENMLNRVIDGTVEVSPEVVQTLNEAVGQLPGLIDSQERGEQPDVDVQPVMDRAFALADPNFIVDETAVAVEEEEVTEDAVEVEVGAQEPALTMDPVLLDIFRAESQGHLETLQRFIDGCKESELNCLVDDKLIRAWHTLHGSAKMSEVAPIAAISAANEKYINQLAEQRAFADGSVIDRLERSVGTIETILASINESEAELPDWQAVVDDVEHAQAAPQEPQFDRIEKSDLAGDAVSSDEPDIDAEAQSEAEVEEEFSVTNDDGQEISDNSNEPLEDEALLSGDEFEPEEQIEIEADLEPGFGEEIELPPIDLDTEEVSEEPDSTEESDEPVDKLDEVEPVGEIDQADEEPAIDSEQVLESELEPESEFEAELTEEPELETTHLEQTSQFSQLVDLHDDPSIEKIEVDGDPELIEIFLEEARELLELIETSYGHWRTAPESKEPVMELERSLHTLKGGARLAGAMPVGDLSHAFETLLTDVGHQRREATPEVIDLAQSVIDRLAEQIEDLSVAPRVRDAEDLIERLEQREGTTEVEGGVESGEIEHVKEEDAEASEAESETEIAEVEETPGETSDEPEVTGAPLSFSAGVADPKEQADAPVSSAKPSREQVRVRSELLDRLVNHAGEVSIYRSRVEQQNSALGFNLDEMHQTVDRLRAQLRQLEIETEAQILFRYDQDKDTQDESKEEFDPLELDRFSTIQQVSRSLMETVNDLNNIYQYLDELQKETDTLLLQQSRITNDLQDGLMRTRMVPFSQLVPRLHRIVRQTCNPLGKQARLEILGAESQLDRRILERIIGSLEHLLRNSVSHGIESPEVRRDAGKDPEGRIVLDVRREGTDILLAISDDGAGIDTNVLRERAIENGMLDPQAEVTDNDVLQFVFEHGFSTAAEVTQIAGRGVGLGVVVSEVKQLGGTLDVSSELNKGSRFTIRMPLTLAIADALLVQLGEEIYAIPHTSILGVVRVSYSELKACYDGQQEYYNYAGQDYQVRYLGALLNVSQLEMSSQRKWYPMLLVRAGEHYVALQIDGVIGNRQIVVKSVGPQISTVRYISGGTILGDGRVALLLDVAALVRLDIAHTAAPVAQIDSDQEGQVGYGRTVMVVDDSITVRKVTGRLLERHGMQVITAKDGVDALATLQEHRPDVMLLDIEMPRMDGYELARHLQNSDELNRIPVIMITSRSGEKHRKRAMELGVKRYLGKPYQEGDLLENIYSVIQEFAP